MENITSQAIEALFDEVASLMELPDNEWKEIGKENDCTVYARKYKDYPLKLVKTKTVLPFSVEIVKQELIVNIEKRPQWDEMIKSASIIKSITLENGDEVTVIQIEAPSMALLSPRDIVFFACVRDDGAGGFSTISRSVVNSEREVPPKKDVIRMDMILSGSKLEPITVNGSPATKLTLISLADPKGKIPKFNLKPLFMKGTASMKALKEHLKKKASN